MSCVHLQAPVLAWDYKTTAWWVNILHLFLNLAMAFRERVGDVDPSTAQPKGQAAPPVPLLPVQLAVEKRILGCQQEHLLC